MKKPSDESVDGVIKPCIDLIYLGQSKLLMNVSPSCPILCAPASVWLAPAWQKIWLNLNEIQRAAEQGMLRPIQSGRDGGGAKRAADG
ncbi:MAG: hypothetical protein ACYYK0_01610 [Candidatus Eutrophobiaceae bacterium]